MPVVERLPQGGFSLTEIMVALAIMTTGILGAACLQGNALQYTNSTRAHLQAISLGQDILERLRLQRSRILDHPDEYTTSSQSLAGYEPSRCDEVACNPVMLAEFEIARWMPSANCRVAAHQSAPMQVSVLSP